FEQRRRSFYFYGFADGSRFEHEVDFGDLIYLELNAVPADSFESLASGLDRVSPRLEQGELIPTAFIRGCLSFRSRLEINNCDLGIRHGGAGRIQNEAVEPRRCLGE